jgi:hypothetical protein
MLQCCLIADLTLSDVVLLLSLMTISVLFEFEEYLIFFLDKAASILGMTSMEYGLVSTNFLCTDIASKHLPFKYLRRCLDAN